MNLHERKIQIYNSIHTPHNPLYIDIKNKCNAWMIDQQYQYPPTGQPTLTTPWDLEIVPVPRQVHHNGGLFTCMFARYIAMGRASDSNDVDMNNIRAIMFNEIFQKRLHTPSCVRIFDT